MSNLRRRQFMIAASALLATSLAVAQQRERKFRVGVLVPFSVSSGEQFLGALRERMAIHGFVEGRNLTLEPRDVGFSRSDARESALELINSKVDAIFALSTIATQGAQDATKSAPIVFSWVGDPVFSGIVKDFARPGGNITGVSNHFFDLYIKRIELVRELVPAAKTVVVIAGILDSTLQAAQARAAPAADRLGFKLVTLEAYGAWARTLEAAAAIGADAIVIATPFTQFGRQAAAQETAGAARRLRIPVIYADTGSVELGGLITYGTNPVDDIRRGADYLARVLKGDSPATLPVDQATRFELVVNLKAAKEIGFKIPQLILLRADRVIE